MAASRALILLGAAFTVLGIPHRHDWATQTPGEKCGYESCTKAKEGFLNVHIVPHTHDDVGWLKTVDQYYYGSRNNIQKAGVQYILDSVVKELWEDHKRRFIYVETAFFWKWWNLQSDVVKRKVHILVRQGRLQFVGGAWSMNDEAAAHYLSIIDQFTWGLKKLNDTFGSCGLPRVGWQIDPFGHSREFASLLAAMGYDGLFLGRIDYQDKYTRLRDKRMEMLWRGDDDLGKSSDIFTGVLYNTYSPPPGFCFDVLCSDEPIIDDPNSPMYNVDKRVAAFISRVQNMSESYFNNNILVTMGDDFNYQDAGMWFKNLDKLIKYTNLKAAKENLNVTLFYSTPNCYLKAVKDANPVLPTKQDDFFPYASDPNSYWTGYFSSRPTTKYFEREANDYLQMVKQLQVLTNLPEHNNAVLDELKSAMGVMQHHDAVTGTEKQHVTHDYERMLDQAVEDALIIARQAFNKVSQGDPLKSVLSYDRCRLNETSCPTSEKSKQFVVTVYNPLAYSVDEPIRIPVVDDDYAVYAPDGSEIKSQKVDISPEILNIPTRKSNATHEIVFIGKLKPLSVKSFYVKKTTKRNKRNSKKSNKKSENVNEYYADINDYWKNIKEKVEVDIRSLEKEEFDNINRVEKKIPDHPVAINEETKHVRDSIDLDVLKNKGESVNSDVEEFEKLLKEENKRIEGVRRSRNGLEKNLYPNLSEEEMRMLSDDPMIVQRYSDEETKDDKIKITVDETGKVSVKTPTKNISFYLTISYYPGFIGNNNVFSNRSSGAYIFRPNATKPVELKTISFTTRNGEIVTEFRKKYSENALSIIRSYDQLSYLDHIYVIGPIPVDDDIGKEYVSRCTTNIDKTLGFYTDSNGRQVIKRKLNKRPQWNLTLVEPIAGNYYPITNLIAIENDDVRMSITPDRSQGATSLNDGELEIMLHRRLLHDDAFGVDEALNEVANGVGLVVTGKQRIYIDYRPPKAKINLMAVQRHFHPIIFVSNAEHLDLDEWYKMMNCYSWLKEPMNGAHLLTLEPWGSNLLMRLENIIKTKESITVNIKNILNHINVKSIKETTLSANRWLDDVEKWEWRKEKAFLKSFNDDYDSNKDDIADDVISNESNADDGWNITLRPKEIRTFVVEYDYSNTI
ncbi:lysosomal alpha-mannosidase isoform 2-T2 [Aphomia sociella]